jgi:hypothetical protein
VFYGLEVEAISGVFKNDPKCHPTSKQHNQFSLPADLRGYNVLIQSFGQTLKMTDKSIFVQKPLS